MHTYTARCINIHATWLRPGGVIETAAVAEWAVGKGGTGSRLARVGNVGTCPQGFARHTTPANQQGQQRATGRKRKGRQGECLGRPFDAPLVAC